ncbi:MAG TPA: class I SAM-dependent methyltransferase [Dehalococcoidia bacterium]
MGEIDRIRAAYARRARQGLDDRYSLTDPANLYLFQRRERLLLAMLRRHGLTPLRGRRILDVGCGTGEVLNDFVQYGAEPSLLAGIDLLEERIAAARRRNPGIAFAVGNAEELPYPDGSFDLALQFTLLSSVLDPAARRRIARETLRVLRPGGAVVWYDFVWNPTNPDVRGLGRREVAALYPGCRVQAQRVTLAPPLSRRLARLSWTACRLLEAVPFLCSHELMVIRKGEAA